MEINPRLIKSVKEHKWFCINCSKIWYLRVDETKEKDISTFNIYEHHVSIHVSDLQHEVIHKEKEEFKIKYA